MRPLDTGCPVEVFGSDYPGKEHFSTGPAAGFAVRDLPGAVGELRSAGIELLGEPGPAWQHFRGPGGTSTSSSPSDLGEVLSARSQLRMFAARPVVAFGETCLRPE